MFTYLTSPIVCYTHPVRKLTLTLLLALPALAWSAGHEHPERWYQEQWCAGRGQMEVVLADGSHCDCLTDPHAIEFDFGHKWAEAIGQALNYAAQTGKRLGIVLILSVRATPATWSASKPLTTPWDHGVDAGPGGALKYDACDAGHTKN